MAKVVITQAEDGSPNAGRIVETAEMPKNLCEEIAKNARASGDEAEVVETKEGT